ncbi:MAG: hypothetical protein NVS9B15_14270 [Acidobacteriaceae bacterium]
MKILVMLALAVSCMSAQQASTLSSSPSAYLRSASKQPVHWYPLSAEAIATSAKLNRPILLDVGATWCSWCAVMDKDSYSHREVAEFINSHFIAIKVDYDSDTKLIARLQRAAAVENLPVGVPLTLFLTPHQTLYYGGTYFPARASAKQISFMDALQKASEEFAEKHYRLDASGTRVDLEGSR